MTTIQQAAERLIAQHGGLRKAARAVNISPAYLSRLRTATKVNPQARVLRFLGIERQVTYVDRQK